MSARSSEENHTVVHSEEIAIAFNPKLQQIQNYLDNLQQKLVHGDLKTNNTVYTMA